MIQRLTGSVGLGRGDRPAGADAVPLEEARGVPQFGREIAIALDALFIELDVAALAFHRRQSEAQSVRTIFVDEAEWIDGVALRLGHFLTGGVADKPVEIERLPRLFAHELEALHRHPSIPEEDDVEARNQDVIGVMAFQFVGLVGPAERRERPQSGGKPGVEHVLIAAQIDARTSLFLCFFNSFRDENIADRIIPRRDAMAPP